MSGPIHSTGRGGAGNIGQDATTYIDGDIIREGQPQEGGEYRGGRGGAGNTAVAAPSPVPVASQQPPVAGAGPAAGTAAPLARSEDVIPESAMRSADGYDNFHTGRGGAGNSHRAEFGGHSAAPAKPHESLLDKAKHAIGLDKDKAEKPATS